MSDHSNALRGAIIEKLKADAGISAIYADRVYDEVVALPTWPFIRVEVSGALLYENSCRKGSEMGPIVHTFHKGPGTKAVAEGNAAVTDCLDDAELPLEPLGFYGIDWARSQILPDGDEKSAYHGVNQFSGTVLDA
jgi:hypothetical protein